MSERESRNINIAEPSYQIATFELLYKSLALANADGSLQQPSLEKGRTSIELVAGSDDSQTLGPGPDVIYINALPVDEVLKLDDVLATVQLCDIMPNNPSVQRSRLVDLIVNYEIVVAGQYYYVQKQHLAFCQTNNYLNVYKPLDDKSLVMTDEIEGIWRLINSYVPTAIDM